MIVIKRLMFLILLLPGCSNNVERAARDGDIIFQTSLSAQSIAIQHATHSKYSHMGMIFVRDGQPYVLEAVSTVRYTPLGAWIARGEGGHYVIKRLSDADHQLTQDAVMRLRQTAGQFVGKPYDLTFEWSDDRMYCSELVWKVYDRSLNVQVGKLQHLKDLDLSDTEVAAKIHERYGSNPPLEETVISPASIFSSPQLVDIAVK